MDHGVDVYARDRMRYDTTQPPTGNDPVELESFDWEMAWATCRALERCGEFNERFCSYHGTNLCNTYNVAECVSRILPRQPSMRVRAALLGKAQFDGASARRCVDAIDAGFCGDALLQQRHDFVRSGTLWDCPAAFRGLSARDEVCVQGSCAPGLFCSDDRRCEPYLSVDAVCSRSDVLDQCGLDHVCSFANELTFTQASNTNVEEPRCTAPRREGGMCISIDGNFFEEHNCEDGLRCVSEHCTSVAIANVGDPCGFEHVCAGDSACVDGRCLANASVGGACRINPDRDTCVGDAMCVDGVCRPAPQEGEVSIDGICASGLYSRGYCWRALKPGEACLRNDLGAQPCETYCGDDNICAPRYELRPERWYAW